MFEKANINGKCIQQMIHGSYLEVLGAPVVEVDTKACVHLHKVMLSCCLKCQVTGGRLHEQIGKAGPAKFVGQR